jgi:hypothetical protein
VLNDIFRCNTEEMRSIAT